MSVLTSGTFAFTMPARFIDHQAKHRRGLWWNALFPMFSSARQQGLEYSRSAFELASKFCLTRATEVHEVTGRFEQKVAESAKDSKEIVRSAWLIFAHFCLNQTRQSAWPIAAIFEDSHLKEKMNVPTSIHPSNGSMAGHDNRGMSVLTAGTAAVTDAAGFDLDETLKLAAYCKPHTDNLAEVGAQNIGQK